MKILYKDQGHMIGRYRAISIGSTDIRLQGTKGWITKHPSGAMSAVISLTAKHEKKYFFDIKDLETWGLRIGRITSTTKQAAYANDLNLMFERFIK